MESLLEKLEEECSCQICYKIFQEPKTLPCLHTFCLPCLNQLAERHRAERVVPCPTCRREIPIPHDGTFNTTASSFLHNRLVELLAIKTSSDKSISCGNCKKGMNACSFCFDCSIIYCRPCLDSHAVLKADHKVRSLKDFQTEDYQDYLQRPMLCSETFHENQPLVLYCNCCKMCLCQLCHAVSQKMHSEHKIIPLDEAAEIRKVSFLSEIESLKKKEELFDEAVRDIDKSIGKINENVDSAKAEVEEFRDRLIASIIQRCDASLAELEKIRYSREISAAQRKFEYEKERDQIHGALEFGKTLIDGKATKHLLREINIDKHFQHLLTDKRDIKNETKVDTFVKFFSCTETKSFAAQTQQLGTIATNRFSDPSKSQLFKDADKENQALLKVCGLSMVTKTPKGDRVYFSADKVELIVDPPKDVSDIQVTNLMNACYELSFVQRFPGRYKVRVKLNGHDIVGSPVEMNITERKITRLCTYTLPGKGEMRPSGVAVSKEGEIAVSDWKNNCIVIFDKTGNFLRKLQSVSLEYPQGIAFNSRDELVVADSGNHRILVLDKRWGRHIKTFGSNNNFVAVIRYMEGSPSRYIYPMAVDVDERDRVIVSDWHHKRIVVFSKNGKFLFQFGKRAENPFQCVRYQDSFFVSDWDNHVIKVYDSDGQFLYKFGEYGVENGQFRHPRGLVVDGRGNLFVCDCDNNRVQMFTVDGRFIGKTTCELFPPFFAAMLDDDKLVVSEFSGNRLRVLKFS